jgi:hypothetical protein
MNKKTVIQIIFISLLCSTISSTATYFLAIRKIPKFATVDLLYLNNSFITELSKFKLEKGASEAEITQMVRNYSKNIDPLLEDISRSGNVMLFQKQAIVTRTDDITDQIARTIFSNTKSINNHNDNETESKN